MHAACPSLLATLPDDDVAAIRAAFVAVGFDERCIAECEAIAPRQLDAVRVPAVLHALLGRDDGASLLTAALVYGAEVPRAALEGAFGRHALGALLRSGAVASEGDRARAMIRVMPYRGLWIASDDLHAADPVMGPGQTTAELAHSLGFDGVASLLDVGCGAGSLALLARAHGVADVVGTDIDPRAIDYARFNGRLNGLSCTWLQGDLGAPALGRRFDAVVSQPAYVAQPGEIGGVTFLHGGARGDELAMRLLGQLGGLLATDGRAWILFDTPEQRPADLAAAVAAALGSGRGEGHLDVCLVATPGHGAVEQSIGYASLHDRTLGAEYAARYAVYRRHLAAQGALRVRHVLLFVRGSAGPGVGFVVEPASLAGYSRAHLEQAVLAVRWSSAPDAALLDAAVRPCASARLVHEQSLSIAADSRLWVRFERGAGVDQELSDTAAVLVTCLRDHQPLSAAIDAWAGELETEPAAVRADVLSFVRGGLRSGLLVVG